MFKLTEGLFDRFGGERVRDTPISEQAIVGAAMGAAMTGLRPIAELMFCDFFAVAWDMVANQIAKTRYMTDGQVSLPLVLRTANGGGLRFGAQHSQSIENWAMAIPGLKVVAPSTPADMKGLLAAAIRDPDPVIVCEHKSAVRDEGRGARRRARRAARARPPSSARAPTRRSWRSRAWCRAPLEAAERLAAEHGVSAEVIDLRTLVPLDVDAILALGREDGPPVHGRGEPAAVRLGRGDRVDRRPTRASGASTRRSSGSRPRTSRCRPRRRSRTSRCRPSTGSSRRSGAGSTRRSRQP